MEKEFEVKEMHKKVRDMIGITKRKANGCIRDKDGNVLFDKDDIISRWAEYVEELYNDERPDMPDITVEGGKDILQGEVEKVIKSMKAGKAVGPDEFPAEALKTC